MTSLFDFRLNCLILAVILILVLRRVLEIEATLSPSDRKKRFTWPSLADFRWATANYTSVHPGATRISPSSSYSDEEEAAEQHEQLLESSPMIYAGPTSHEALLRAPHIHPQLKAALLTLLDAEKALHLQILALEQTILRNAEHRFRSGTDVAVDDKSISYNCTVCTQIVGSIDMGIQTSEKVLELAKVTLSSPIVSSTNRKLGFSNEVFEKIWKGLNAAMRAASCKEMLCEVLTDSCSDTFVKLIHEHKEKKVLKCKLCTTVLNYVLKIGEPSVAIVEALLEACPASDIEKRVCDNLVQYIAGSKDRYKESDSAALCSAIFKCTE